MLFSIFARTISSLKWSIIIIFGRKLFISRLQVSVESKSVSVFVWVTNYFPLSNSVFTGGIWQAFNCSIVSNMKNAQTKYIPWFLRLKLNHPPCHSHCSTLSKFPPYSTGEKYVPLEQHLSAKHCSLESIPKRRFLRSLQS